MISRRDWKENVIDYLKSVYTNNFIDRKKAKLLIDQDTELNRIAENKRRSNERIKLMRKVNGTETIKVNKHKNEELKILLAKAMECIE